MAKRINIYVGEPASIILAGWETERSARINEVCDGYLHMVVELTPLLTLGQWCVLVDVTNGTELDSPGLNLLWASVADAVEDGIGEKWGVDLDELSAFIHGLSMGQLVAVREVIRRFWTVQENTSEAMTYEQMLAKAGAKFKQ